MTITIEQVRQHIEGLVAEKCSKATPGQRQALVDRLMDQDAARDEALRPLIMHPEIGAALNLDTILRTEPATIRAVPSVADIIEHNARKYRENLGYEPPTEVKMNLYREFADADADKRLATGVEAGIAPKPSAETNPPGRTPGAHDFHNWRIDDPRFSDVLRERGFDVNNMLPSKRREYIEHLQAQSYTHVQRINDTTRTAIEQRATIRPLSAEQRITQHRLNEARK